MLNQRQISILQAIIQDHLDDGQPVGSSELVKKHRLKVSSATVRNEMGELEQTGYLEQPHTSAGRVPTAKGWRFYLDHCLADVALSKTDERFLTDHLDEAIRQGFTPVKALAKALAELSADAVLVGFAPHDVYYTGLRNLVTKPEFCSLDFMTHLTEIVDQLDEGMAKIFDRATDEVSVLVGSEHPFGHECGVLFTVTPLAPRHKGILGILGPMRLRYAENIARLKYARAILAQNFA